MDMCVRCEKQRKVFAHGYLVPKETCGCGCRTARLVAVSEDGREFSYTVDESRYALSGWELWDAFEAYLKECYLAPGGEIWFSQSYDETFRGTLAPCEPCNYSNCFVLSDNMEYFLPNGMKELRYEYLLRAAFLERKQSFDEFRKECGYDPANEPYAGRELYHAYKQQVDKDEFSPEECGKIAAYLRAGIGKIGAVGELVWVEALRVLLRDAPALFAEVLDEFCTMYEGLNEDERETWAGFIELLYSELCASDKKEAQSAWEKHIWRLAYPSMQKEAAEAIARGIDAEERAEQALWARRKEALAEFLGKYRADSAALGPMYLTPDGSLVDCSSFPNGYADVSAWLNERGLEIDFVPGEASKLLRDMGWLRLEPATGYAERDGQIASPQQKKRLEELCGRS